MSILFLLLGLLFVACAATVLLSGAFLWYETANRQSTLVEERFAADRVLFAARLLLTETLCLFITILQRPLAWFGNDKKPILSSPRPPVLLLNGLFHNRSCWGWMARQLSRRGLRVYTLTLPLWHTPERSVDVLATSIEELNNRGAPLVDLVGHSMGALVIRQYMQEHGTTKVRRCILLGAPNHGSRLAPFAISPLGRRLLPGSAYLQQLNRMPFPEDVRGTTIFSRHDNLVIPWESGRLEGVRNIELTGIGHCTLLYHPEVIDQILKGLTEETDANT